MVEGLCVLCIGRRFALTSRLTNMVQSGFPKITITYHVDPWRRPEPKERNVPKSACEDKNGTKGERCTYGEYFENKSERRVKSTGISSEILKMKAQSLGNCDVLPFCKLEIFRQSMKNSNATGHTKLALLNVTQLKPFNKHLE